MSLAPRAKATSFIHAQGKGCRGREGGLPLKAAQKRNVIVGNAQQAKQLERVPRVEQAES
eukprot:3934145-Rhodomonas_salina.1